MTSKNNFNRIAPIYDLLSTIIFRNSIKSSQLHFLNFIKPNSSILIIGGGTGWYLEKLLSNCSCKTIVYLDSSIEMINLSKKKISNSVHNCEVTFINSTIEELNLDEQFDVIVTNFFLDLFDDKSLCQIIHKTAKLIKDDGIWLFCDFIKNKKSYHRIWQNILIAITFMFFKISSNVQNNKLRDYEKFFMEANLSKLSSHLFYKGMIESCIYKKN